MVWNDQAMSIEGRRIRIVGEGALARSLAASLRELGAVITDASEALDAAVFAPWDASAMVPRPLIELTDEEFGEAWQQTMDAAIAMCVDARRSFDGRAGNIVLTFPTTAFVGGACTPTGQQPPKVFTSSRSPWPVNGGPRALPSTRWPLIPLSCWPIPLQPGRSPSPSPPLPNQTPPTPWHSCAPQRPTNSRARP